MNQRVGADSAPIPFIDLVAQRNRLQPAIDEAIARVVAHCQFILGPEVRAFETALAAYCGAKHAVTCASGTDALLLVLRAKGVGPGDAVLCPSFTFCATAEVAVLMGATPVFADVDADTFNLNAASLERAIVTAKRLGLKPKVVIPVDLFGLPADYDAISAVAKSAGLYVLDDAAQAFGAKLHGRPLGTLAPATATSFFPAKPLGCYGDGGAVMTDDGDLAELLRSLRMHGQGADRYDNTRIGTASRLDTIQAAVLIEKLKIFSDEIDARNRAARRYADGLARRRDRAPHSGRHDVGLGAVHDPPQARAARSACAGAQGQGHPDRDLLSQAGAPPGGLPQFPGGGWRPAGQRRAGAGGHQPADARLSGRADAGPHHQCGAQ